MSGEDVSAFAEMVRRMFKRKKSPGDLDDVQQDAACEVLETYRRRGLPLKGNRRYYYVAASRAAGLAVSRSISVVSFAEKQAKRARTWQDRERVSATGAREDGEAGDVDLPGDFETDAAVRRRERDAAVARLQAALARHIRAFSPRQQRALQIALGIGEHSADDLSEVAWRTGLQPAAVSQLLRRLGDLVRADADAIAARRAMLEHREDT